MRRGVLDPRFKLVAYDLDTGLRRSVAISEPALVGDDFFAAGEGYVQASGTLEKWKVPFPVDGDVYLALEQQDHPACAASMVRFLELEQDTSRIEGDAQRVFPGEPEKAKGFAARVAKAHGSG